MNSLSRLPSDDFALFQSHTLTETDSCSICMDSAESDSYLSHPPSGKNHVFHDICLKEMIKIHLEELLPWGGIPAAKCPLCNLEIDIPYLFDKKTQGQQPIAEKLKPTESKSWGEVAFLVYGFFCGFIAQKGSFFQNIGTRCVIGLGGVIIAHSVNKTMEARIEDSPRPIRLPNRIESFEQSIDILNTIRAERSKNWFARQHVLEMFQLSGLALACEESSETFSWRNTKDYLREFALNVLRAIINVAEAFFSTTLYIFSWGRKHSLLHLRVAGVNCWSVWIALQGCFSSQKAKKAYASQLSYLMQLEA